MDNFQCVCGKSFKSKAARSGHYASCIVYLINKYGETEAKNFIKLKSKKLSISSKKSGIIFSKKAQQKKLLNEQK